MDKLKKQNLTKKIICIIITLMLCNFIIPNYSFAALEPADDNKLLQPLAQFLCFVPDIVIGFLQNMFVSPQGIELSRNNYEILYSPGAIFAGKIPAFDINFIDPRESKTATGSSTPGLTEAVIELEKLKADRYVYTEENDNIWKNFLKVIDLDCFEEIEKGTALMGGPIRDFRTKYGYYDNNLAYIGDSETSKINRNDPNSIYSVTEHLRCRDDSLEEIRFWVNNDILYMYQFYDTPWTMKNEWFVYKCKLNTIADGIQGVEQEETYQSSAQILQTTVASWYNALRRIALVGLLSVLLYVGIKIVLSSTSAKDKAKYKKMLKDWLVALCILFTLHYIMSITITVVGEINKVIGASAIGANGEDVLMTTIRNKIAGGNEDFGNVLTEVVLYFVLGIFTIIYTIQYIRRTIYIAFLTMIAPLITLTYPLDKIKDGKAQAFDMWIKDYIFFVLIQVVHLLLYYILVEASLDLASDGNWLFAIVAIGFLTKAEKIVKKMFGFEKSKSMGALAAGATGAFVMNAINKIKAPGKASKGGQAGAARGDSGNVRTATNTDVMASIRNGGEIHSNPSSSSNSVDAKPAGSNSVVSNSEKMKRNISGVLKAGGDMLKTGAKGTGALAKRYHRKIGGAALGVGTGLAGSILGFAAGVSQGDMGAAFGGALAGGKAGYNLGGRAYNGAFDTAENIRRSVNNLYDTWNEGAYGEEYANNEKFDREFRRSSTYKTLKQKYGKDFSDDNIQEMLEAGITEKDAMDKILKNVTSGNRYAIKDAMGYYALTKKCKDAGVYNSDAKLKQWLKDNDFGEINDVTQIRKHMKNF